MRIFISWSGKLSQSIAKELFEWLPMIVQSIDPYMSSESIEKGARWASSVASELEEAKFGILVLVQDNVTSPWIHFEAGALAKIVDESKLAPLLFGLKPSDVHPPLSQFQVTVFEKEEVWKLIKGINSTKSDDGLPEFRLQKMFDALWPALDEKIRPLIDDSLKENRGKSQSPERDSSAIIEEILVLSRQQVQILSSPERNFPLEIFKELTSTLDEIRNINRLGKINSDLIEVLFDRWAVVRNAIQEISGGALDEIGEKILNLMLKN